MSDKYTYADVIIDPEDPRVEVGEEYWYAANPNVALERANEGNTGNLAVLEGISKRSLYDPFSIGVGSYPCIIRKKEPEKKYVPFDLSNEKDREKLRGAWIRKKDNSEIKLIWWFWEMDGKWMIDEDIGPQELLDNWVFDFEGLPCGKLVEEE